ncbi:MAG: hypothetical protein MK135_03170, partial [Polyangiaceae bacterium]|nr:hypothetical protein [Polyangiaceae bacterium]
MTQPPLPCNFSSWLQPGGASGHDREAQERIMTPQFVDALARCLGGELELRDQERSDFVVKAELSHLIPRHLKLGTSQSTQTNYALRFEGCGLLKVYSQLTGQQLEGKSARQTALESSCELEIFAGLRQVQFPWVPQLLGWASWCDQTSAGCFAV